MTRLEAASVHLSVLFVLLAGGLALTSCDLASAGNTAILNANSAIPPTVQHRFEYTQDQLSAVSMIESEDLGEILSQNGFSRSDVASARVDSVRVEPVSTVSLSAVEIFLGTDPSGPPIANVELQPDQPAPVTDASGASVTGAVKAGEMQTFAQFSVQDPSSIPAGGGVVRAVVYYRVEVEGV